MLVRDRRHGGDPVIARTMEWRVGGVRGSRRRLASPGGMEAGRRVWPRARSPAHERAAMRSPPPCSSPTPTTALHQRHQVRQVSGAFSPASASSGPAAWREYYPRRCGGWSPVTLARQYRLQRDRLDLLRGYARDPRGQPPHGRRVRPARSGIVRARGAAAGGAGATEAPRHPAPADDPTAPGGCCSSAGSRRPRARDIALESAALAARRPSRRSHLQLSGEGSRRSRLAARASALMAAAAEPAGRRSHRG